MLNDQGISMQPFADKKSEPSARQGHLSCLAHVATQRQGQGGPRRLLGPGKERAASIVDNRRPHSVAESNIRRHSFLVCYGWLVRGFLRLSHPTPSSSILTSIGLGLSFSWHWLHILSHIHISALFAHIGVLSAVSQILLVLQLPSNSKAKSNCPSKTTQWKTPCKMEIDSTNF